MRNLTQPEALNELFKYVDVLLNSKYDPGETESIIQCLRGPRAVYAKYEAFKAEAARIRKADREAKKQAAAFRRKARHETA